MRRIAAITVAFVVSAGCRPNPAAHPEMRRLAGTWIPTTHAADPPTQFLILEANGTFVAQNFPVSPAFGQKVLASGTGTWELVPSYAAFLVKFRLHGSEHAFRVVGRYSPFKLAGSIYDDDETLESRRLENAKK